MENNVKKKVQDKAVLAVKAYILELSFNNNSLRNYTGNQEGSNDKPEQDEDDL